MLALANPGLWQNALHNPVTWVFTLVLAVLFPIVDYVLYARLKSALQIYAWNICSLWTLTFACVWVLHSNHLSPADIGLSLGNRPWTLAISAAILVLVGLSVTTRKKTISSKTRDEKLGAAVGRIRRLLPFTSAERAVWVPVSLTAGLCEEFLYRGWVLILFAGIFGHVWAGLIVSSIIFGFAHSYQGRTGVIGTAVLGMVFGLLFVFTRSLIPGQIFHTLLDITNGLALARVARRLETATAQSLD